MGCTNIDDIDSGKTTTTANSSENNSNINGQSGQSSGDSNINSDRIIVSDTKMAREEVLKEIISIEPCHQFADEFVVIAFRKGIDDCKHKNSGKMMEDLVIEYFHTVDISKRKKK